VGDALGFSVLWTIGLATVFGVPFSVVLVYSGLRGGTTAGERRLRELYRLVLEEDIHGSRCFSCREEVEADWLVCPACTAELRGRCPECDALVKPHWSACPWCTTALDEPLPVPLRLAA
jgi:hypothetical protein